MRDLTKHEQTLFNKCKCSECPLNKETLNPVFGQGSLKPTFILVAEAPGREEDKQGKPMVGQSGQLSDQFLVAAGTTRESIYVTNTVLCRPPNNETPPQGAITACSERLKAELASLETPVVLATGAVAAHTLLNTTKKITSLNGAASWSNEYDKFVVPTFHPAYILRNRNSDIGSEAVETYKQALMFSSGKVALPPRNFELKYEYADTARKVNKVLDALERAAERDYLRVACDTETTYAGDPNYELLLVQISTGEQTYVLEAEPLLKPSQAARFAALLTSDRITWTFHNLCFDVQHLKKNFGVVPTHSDDTMALNICLTEKEKTGKNGLKKLSQKWLGASTYEEAVKSYPPPSSAHPWSEIPRKELIPYAALDAYYTYHLYHILYKLVQEAGNYSLYQTILLPAQKAFVDMELHGILIDKDQMDKARAAYGPIVKNLEKQAQDFAESKGFKASESGIKTKPKTESISMLSVPQRRHLFYDILGYKPIVDPKSRTHLPTTGEMFYTAYPNETVTKLFSSHHHAFKMISTYITGVEDDIHPDNRVRPSFLIQGAATGRLSAKDTPIQTVPKDTLLYKEFGKDFVSLRKAYVAPKDFVFVEADYNALELYIAYHYSNDENMYKALQSGDFHRQAASNAFNIPWDKVDEERRDASKCISYGVMYRLQAVALQKQIGGTIEQCQTYIDNWFEGFSNYKKWWQEQQDIVGETGRLSTATGRIRSWDCALSDRDENRMLNQAVNFPIQSLANDLCLDSLITLNTVLQELDYGFVIMTVHDSIEFELRQSTLHEAVKVIHDVMTSPPFESPLDYFPISVKVGPNWAELKTMEMEYARPY